MDAKELRIGNYAHLICEGHEGEPDLIEWSVDDFEFYKHRMKDVIPIPLTEELFLKFGFEDDGLGFFSKKISMISKIIWSKEHGVELSCKYYTVLGKKQLKLHQLQNLYFALTGEELILNQ